MLEVMKKAVKFNVELTVEEQNLLSMGYKNLIGPCRAAWKVFNSMAQKEKAKGNEQHAKMIKEYRLKVESELSDICSDVMTVIDEHLIPSSTTAKSLVFYNNKMKGDYYRYLAEFKTGSKNKNATDQS
ncbi:14-3-3-like protein C [Zingiber officinale]|nr:14-3-3-like protein C [Zingiber officinale]